MMRLALWILLSLLATSCARQQSASSRLPTVFDSQVRNAANLGDGDLEVQALRKRLLENPRDASIRRRLADRFESTGYPDLALEHLRIAFELAPADTQLGLDLAVALKQQGLPTQALQVLEATLRNPSPTTAQLSRAAILTDTLVNLKEGEILHKKALALDPASLLLANNLAYNWLRQQRASEAEQLFRQILRTKPSYEVARNNLATLYATQLHQPEEALLHWKAISGPAAAHNNLAATYMEQEKWPEAKAELEKALALRFQFPEAIQNLQLVAARTGGTVELKLDRDKKQSGLSKLAKAFRHAFISEEDESQMSKTRRSRP
jgi:tetratricopeptide (TPR) repeat protein